MEDRLKKKVLIVDDDATARMNLTQILQNDYRVFVAENAKEALERAANEENMPDIILLDIGLPDKYGFEVCKELKDNPKTRHIPVIYITAREALRERCLETGGVDIITKGPHETFDSTTIKERVRIHLERSGHLCSVYNRSKAIQTRMQDILKEHQEIISGLESLMKIPYPGKE
jgi:PleD family two-component response regulator